MKIHKYDNTFIVEKNGMPYQVIDGMEEYNGLMTEYGEYPSLFMEEYEYVPTFEEYRNTCCECCKGKLLTQYDLGIQFAYNNEVFWIKANDNTQLQAGSKKTALVGKTTMSSVDLSWFADGYYSDGELIKGKKMIIFAGADDVNEFLLKVSEYFQGCIYAYLAKKEEISLCQSKNQIECVSDIVFPNNKL